ncbi:MAG: hypothetical protein U5N55_01285 [Cypionkella sp.]|nr:hypothetical protein [Cypionkella sp.]
MQALNAATLQITNNTVNTGAFDTLITNSGGELRASGAGSVVRVDSFYTDTSEVAIHGGTIRAQDGGDVIFGGGLLDGDTEQGAATLVGGISADALFLRGETANQGSIHLRDSAANADSGGTIFVTAEGAELTGGGTIVMDETTGSDSITGAAQEGRGLDPALYTPSQLVFTDQLVTGGGLIWSEFQDIGGYYSYVIQLILGSDGEVRATAGHTMTIGTKYTITNDGTLHAMGGVMKLYDQVTGTGQVLISSGGRMEVRADFGSDITFSASATATAETLVFTDWDDDGDNLDYNQTIRGMGVGDRVFFAGTLYGDFNSLMGSPNKFSWVQNGTGGTIRYVVDGETLTYNVANVPRAELELTYSQDFGVGFVRLAATKGTSSSEKMTGTSGEKQADRLVWE